MKCFEDISRIATALEGIWKELQKFNTPAVVPSTPSRKRRVRKYEWTDDKDAILIRMRSQGKTYELIGKKLHISETTVLRRAYELRANGKYVD